MMFLIQRIIEGVGRGECVRVFVCSQAPTLAVIIISVLCAASAFVCVCICFS